jgi:hypothetical protein
MVFRRIHHGLLGLVIFIIIVISPVRGLPTLSALDQLSQVCRSLSLLNEWMFKHLFGRRPLPGIPLQTHFDELLEWPAEVAIQARGWVLGNQKQNFHGMNICVGRISTCQLNSRDTQRPNVCFIVISRLFDDFRGHPKGRSNESILLRHRCRQLTRNAKISQFDLATGTQQNIRSWQTVS